MTAGAGDGRETTEVTTAARPWYREPWPWFLIALPAAAVVSGAVTLWLAASGADGLVVSDYYKRGLAINSELARTARATELALRSEVTLEGTASGDRVRVRISADRPLPAETTLKLTLVHPGRSGADRIALLARVSADADARTVDYAGTIGESVPLSTPVAWQVAIESPTWRIDGRISAGEGRMFRLSAGR